MLSAVPTTRAAADSDVPPPSDALVQAEIDRIAACDTFARSPRRVKLLRHLIGATRAGDATALREMSIGIDFFGRDPANYDPRHDSIVRVEVRRLRVQLGTYYADEGLDARLEFVLPLRAFEVVVMRRNSDPAARPRSSLAVFEFDADLGAANHAALAGAESAAQLTHDFSGWLLRLNGLRLVPAPPTPDGTRRASVARRLGAAFWLAGRIEVTDQAASIDLTLSRTDDGALLWSKRLPLPASERARVDAARGLIAVLHHDAAARRLQRIGPASNRLPMAAKGPSADAAGRRTVIALAQTALGLGGTEAVQQAVLLLQAAVNRNADDATAQALLAQALLAQSGLTGVASRPALEAARAAARAALELDPDLSAAHGVLGMVRLLVDHDWPRAEARLLAALRCGPGDGAAHARYGWALMMNRRFTEASAAYAEAIDLAPASLTHRAHAALVALYRRDWVQAAIGLDEVLSLQPEHLVACGLRAALDLYAGDATGARARYAAITRRWPALSIGRCGLAQADALLGDHDGARELLAGLQHDAATQWISPYQIAMVQTRLGEHDAAFGSLQAAAIQGDFNLVCVAVDPAFDTLHADGRWPALLRSNGMGHLTDC